MGSRLKALHFSDFTGGLVTNSPSVELDIKYSPDLDNIVLREKGFVKRFGDSEFNATAMNSGANVQGLAYYKESGNKEYLVAIAGAKMYRSDSLDGTMDELSLAGGSAAPTAGQNNIWTPMILKNLLIWVGGQSTSPNPPKSWDGSTAANNYQNLAGTPPAGYMGFVTHDRCFIGRTAAEPSELAWCVLANPEDWTGAGSGQTTFVTNDGDFITAGVPLNNDLALIFKQYSIHYLATQSAPFPAKPFVKGTGCCGKHAAVNVNGVVYFISMDKRMKSTDGYTITSYPDTLDDIWDTIPDARREYIQGIYEPSTRLIHWIVSKGSGITANNYDIIWDTDHNCWLRNTSGFDCNVMCIAQGYKLYGGHTNGKIYLKSNPLVNNDASETSPGIVNGYWKTANMNLGNNVISKQFLYADISFAVQTSGVLEYEYGYDYNLTASGSLSTMDPGGRWDVDTWDGTLIWGGQNDLNSRIFIRGRGNNFQLKLCNNRKDESLSVNSFDLSGKASGEKDINAT